MNLQFNSDAIKYHFQLMSVFKPTNWASDPGLGVQGTGAHAHMKSSQS